jgi:hypothetical protein
LNGKFLGYLHVPKVNLTSSSDDLVRVFRDLQAQGATLLKHAFRPKEYLVLCVGGFELPSLTYRFDYPRFNKRVTKRFQALLASTEPQRVDMFWHEDDTKALKRISWSESPDQLRIHLNSPHHHEKFRVLAWTTNQPKLRIGVEESSNLDFSFLEFFKHVQHLELDSSSIMSFSSPLRLIWPSVLPPSITKLSLLSAIFNEVELDMFANLVSLDVTTTTPRQIASLARLGCLKHFSVLLGCPYYVSALQAKQVELTNCGTKTSL